MVSGFCSFSASWRRHLVDDIIMLISRIKVLDAKEKIFLVLTAVPRFPKFCPIYNVKKWLKIVSVSYHCSKGCWYLISMLLLIDQHSKSLLINYILTFQYIFFSTCTLIIITYIFHIYNEKYHN